jgi:4-hydroxybenzoyl-CoA thioesterase
MLRNSTARFVQFGDCDPAGIIYYPRYFVFFDDATTELLSVALRCSIHLSPIRGRSIGVPAVQADATFLAPVSFGDLLKIETSVTNVGRSSFSLEHLVRVEDAVRARGTETRVLVKREVDNVARATVLPDDLRTALLEL